MNYFEKTLLIAFTCCLVIGTVIAISLYYYDPTSDLWHIVPTSLVWITIVIAIYYGWIWIIEKVEKAKKESIQWECLYCGGSNPISVYQCVNCTGKRMEALRN